jgi:hypothetical protein
MSNNLFLLSQYRTWLMQTAYVVWPQTKNPAYFWDVTNHRHITWLKIRYFEIFIFIA